MNLETQAKKLFYSCAPRGHLGAAGTTCDVHQGIHYHHTRRNGRMPPEQVYGLGDGAVELECDDTGNTATQGGEEPAKVAGLSVAIEENNDQQQWNGRDGAKDEAGAGKRDQIVCGTTQGHGVKLMGDGEKPLNEGQAETKDSKADDDRALWRRFIRRQ